MYATRIEKEGKKLRLNDLPTRPPRGIDKPEGEQRLAKLGAELFELQDLLYAAKTHAVLVVLQGRDAAGKDGVIKSVVGALNPRGVSVVSFGVPSEEERAHDFLWRIHRHTPRAGEFAIFNRSHYEDVLVVRIHKLVPEELWRERFDHINDFEELLTEHNTIVLKFFLNISPEEQLKRLLDREREASKAWKVNIGDWEDRGRWEKFTAAYQDVLGRCSRKHAPWWIVPADSKWFRNLAVAEVIADTLRGYRHEWMKSLDRASDQARRRMVEYRRRTGAPRP